MGKQEKYKNLLKMAMSAVVWTLETLVWGWCWMDNYAGIILRPFGYKGNWLVIAVYAVLLLVFTSFYGGFRIGYYLKEDVILSGFISIIITNAVTYLQTCLVGRAIMNALPFLIMSAIQAVITLVWAFAAGGVYARVFPPHRLLLIYGGSQQAASLTSKLITRSEKYEVAHMICIDQGLDAVLAELGGYRAAVLCDLPPKLRNTIVKHCFKYSVRTYISPKISDILLRNSSDINLFDTPLWLGRNNGLTIEQRVIKRLMDIAFSLLALVAGAPFMLLTALAIKLYDGGPVIFRQKRLTINGKIFDVIKFRSMVVDAEKEGGARWASRADERVTPIGRLIRRVRFDEWPQFFNILKGDMSIVGPRPERPELAEQFELDMKEFSLRLKVKAGLTGYAQIYGKYDTMPYDKLKLDLMYISGYSTLLDLKLLAMTIKVIFRRQP